MANGLRYANDETILAFAAALAIGEDSHEVDVGMYIQDLSVERSGDIAVDVAMLQTRIALLTLNAVRGKR